MRCESMAAGALLALGWLASGCSPCAGGPGCLVAEDLGGGLLSVRAPAEDDVWIVGASPDPDDGTGPTLLSWDGGSWTRHDTSAWSGTELWWAHVTATEGVFVGSEGLILELDRATGELVEREGPDTSVTFFGVWGGGDGELWAVGQSGGGEGPPALWRRQSGTWAAWSDPGIEAELGTRYFKMDGTSPTDAWIVGSDGIALHWDGTGLTASATDGALANPATPLLTVDTHGDRPVAVGGFGNAVVLEHDGSAWIDASPEFQPGYNGVCSNGEVQWAVGQTAARAERVDGTWSTDRDRELTPVTVHDWHGCAVDPAGNLWTVGGRISARPLNQGVIGYQGAAKPKTPTL